MKILAIDTTTKVLSIAAFDNGKIYEYNLKLGNLQSQLLMPAIKRITDTLKWRLADIDYFACGLGPGSFTGIRVGISTIKGLSWSLNKPVIGVPTLDLLAENAADFSGIIFTVIDAKRSLIYCSAYRNNHGELKKIMPDSLLSKEATFKKIRPNSIILGDALSLYKQDFARHSKNANFLESEYWYPQGHNLIYLALKKIKAKKLNNAFNIKPVYLYPDECQIKK